MTAPKPLTDAEKSRILALHADGHSCRAIARETGRSFTACAKVVRDAGRATKTGQTADATAARIARANESRLDRAEALLDEATEIQAGMWDPVVDYMSTPHGPVRIERDPTARELKTSVDAIARIADTVDKLIAAINIDGNAEHRSMVEQLAEGLKAVRGQLKEQPDDGS